MKKLIYMALFLTSVIMYTGCSKNYYSGSGKAGNCGCPGKKGMVGY